MPDPAAQPQPNPAAPDSTTDAVTGSQLASVPSYDGTEGLDVELWLNRMDRAKTQFNWSDTATAQAALTKLTGSASNWLNSLDRTNTTPTTWEGEQGLRKALKDRFYPIVTALEASQATYNLKQLAQETVSQFYDRCIIAIDKKNHALPEPERNNEQYKRQFEVDLFTFYSAGLHETIRRRTLAANNPPTTPRGLLHAAKTVEAEESHRQIATVSANEVGTSETPESAPAPPKAAADEPLQKQIELLTAAIQSLNRGGSRKQPNNSGRRNLNSNIICYFCRKPGHIARNCYARQNSLRGRRGGWQNSRSFGNRQPPRQVVAETDHEQEVLGVSLEHGTHLF